MTPQARLQVANKKKLCYNCLKMAIHKPEDCRVDRVCSTDEYKLKHSYMLHDALTCVPNDQSQLKSAETCAMVSSVAVELNDYENVSEKMCSGNASSVEKQGGIANGADAGPKH